MMGIEGKQKSRDRLSALFPLFAHQFVDLDQNRSAFLSMSDSLSGI